MWKIYLFRRKIQFVINNYKKVFVDSFQNILILIVFVLLIVLLHKIYNPTIFLRYLCIFLIPLNFAKREHH